MPTKPAISPQAAQAAVEAHGDRLFRLCFVLLGSSVDAEDAGNTVEVSSKRSDF